MRRRGAGVQEQAQVVLEVLRRGRDETARRLLAAIDAKTSSVPKVTIDRYVRVLDSLEQKCAQARAMIGDMAVKAVQMLREEEQITITVLSFMEQMDAGVPDGIPEMNCAATSSGYSGPKVGHKDHRVNY